MAYTQIELLLSGIKDASGEPLSGGKVYTYESGTTTPKTTYTDLAATTPAANPIILDSNGRAQVYGDGTFKFDIDDASDTDVYTFDEVIVKAADDGLQQGGATGGSSDAYTLTLDPALSAYAAHQVFEFSANHTNTTTTPTLNINSLGAKTITNPYGDALFAGAIESGGYYTAIYDSTNFRLMNSNLDVQSWTPSLTYSGTSITLTDTYTNEYAYFGNGKWVWFSLFVQFTLVGTGTNVNFTLPVSNTGGETACSAFAGYQSTTSSAAMGRIVTSTVIVRGYDAAQWTAGARHLSCCGVYYVG